jgi:hypothetical protein
MGPQGSGSSKLGDSQRLRAPSIRVAQSLGAPEARGYPRLECPENLGAPKARGFSSLHLKFLRIAGKDHYTSQTFPQFFSPYSFISISLMKILLYIRMSLGMVTCMKTLIVDKMQLAMRRIYKQKII